MMVAAGSLVVLLMGAIAWESRPVPVDDLQQTHRPLAAAAGLSGAVSSTSGDSATPLPAVPPASGEFLDLSRAGTAAFLTGDIEKAKAQFEGALERKPDDPETLNSIGQILDRQGDVPGAVARFEQAIQLAPDRWAYHFNLAHASGRLGEWERAVDEYREAARLFPEDYATQFNLGIALRRLGNDKAAIPEFEKAIKLAPAEASFHLELGSCFQSVGKLADARKAFETYLEMEPSAPDAEKVKAHIEALAASSAQSATSAPGS